MSQILNHWSSILLGIAVLAPGCEQPDEAPVTTEMREDFDHDHEHVHGEGQDHEHEHADGHEGRHSHPHSHSHRHGAPLHGGRIVSIGHTHHGDDETHYHAEVMPVMDGTITFHVLTEADDGESHSFPISAREITAYVSEPELDPVLPSQAREVTFTGDGAGDSAKFSAAVPEALAQSERFSVVIPKIVLGGERFRLSFNASRAEATTDSASTDGETAQ